MTRKYQIANTEFINETSIQEITIQGEVMKTTPGLYKILSELLANQNKIYTKIQIEKILGIRHDKRGNGGYRGSHTVYTFISNIKCEFKRISKILQGKGLDVDLRFILVTKKDQGYYLKT